MLLLALSYENPYCHKTYRRFMKEQATVGQMEGHCFRNLRFKSPVRTLLQKSKVQISCKQLTKELTVLFWLIPKCMGQAEVLKM
jgi:hypothetical protein